MANDTNPSGIADNLRAQITENSDGSLKAPDNIIQNVRAARAIYFKYREEHLKRIQLYSQIEGLIAGNPPYNPGELQKHGLSHIANFNPLDGRSLYEKGALAYWNLLNQAKSLVKFKLRIQDQMAVKWADTMALHWDFVVRQWEGFSTQMNTLSAQLVKFGISPVLWSDERDWRWTTIELSKFFVPDQAQSDVCTLTAVAVESFFTVQTLFEIYEEYKDVPKDECPWDKDELSKLLLYIANSFAKTGGEIVDVMDMQRRLQNGDLSYDITFSDSIRLVSLLYKEYDGKITHYMFHRTYDNGEILYFADRQYESIQDALVIFTASPGEATLHSNRGLGHKIFAPSQAMMQLDCSIVDMARWSSTPLLKGLATGSRDFETIRFYPGVPTNIGNAEFVQNNLGSNINQLVGASQYMLQKMQYNIANSGDDPSMPDSDKGSISNNQARAQAFKEFGVLKNNIAHFYNQYDTVTRNMVRKMLHSKKGYPGYEFAKEWKQRCIEDGVPEEMFSIAKLNMFGLPRHLEVHATRVAGDGSTFARIMGLESLAPLAPTFGPKAAREYNREYISATMGEDYVEAFMPSSDDVDENSGGASLAGVENAVMESGRAVVFSMDNEHQGHFGTHMALAVQTIQKRTQQEMDAIEADRIFTILAPHLAEHFQALSNSFSGSAMAQQQKKNFEQVMEYARLNRKNATAALQKKVREEQEAAEKQQQVMSDQELKNMQAVNDEKRKDLKVQSQVVRAKEASDTRAGIMKDKVISDAQNQRLKIALDAQNKKIENMNEAEAKSELRRISGNTPSPNDIEGI